MVRVSMQGFNRLVRTRRIFIRCGPIEFQGTKFSQENKFRNEIRHLSAWCSRIGVTERLQVAGFDEGGSPWRSNTMIS